MNIQYREKPYINGCQVLTVSGIDCILPYGMKAVNMWFLTPYLIGTMTPAVTYNQKLRYNNDIFGLLTISNLVHECVHGYQERRMGKVAYRATYFWQMFLSLFRVGPAHIHADHLLEREARRIGEEVQAEFDYNVKVLDIEHEILKRTGWKA